jgi:mono/diheme cytochrome c family protein
MTTRTSIRILAALLGVLGIWSTAGATEPAVDQTLAGQALFLKNCAGCHGAEGAGDGAARGWLASPPRDLRTGFLDRYSTPELIDRVLLGAPLQIELDPEAMRLRAGETEAVVAYLEQLPDVDWPSVDLGADIYLHRCESCHGPWGEPPASAAEAAGSLPDLGSAAFQAGTSDTELNTTVRHGRHGMPALVPQIKAGEALDLVRFVRHLSAGFAIYDQTCAQCHGDRGQGVGSLADAEALPTVTFDAAYLARADPDDLRVKTWHMLGEHRPRMPHFRGRLSPDEARRIVSYLQSRTSLPTPRRGAGRTPAADNR